MKQQTVIAIVFFIAAILMMINSIMSAVNGQSLNWLFLIAGCCFLVGGVVFFIQGVRANDKGQD